MAKTRVKILKKGKKYYLIVNGKVMDSFDKRKYAEMVGKDFALTGVCKKCKKMPQTTADGLCEYCAEERDNR